MSVDMVAVNDIHHGSYDSWGLQPAVGGTPVAHL